MISASLREQAEAWIRDDPDLQDRAELRALLDSADPAAETELIDRFVGRLRFGTAGLRGAMAAGPNRMNRAVVRGTTAALAGWLGQRDSSALDSGVVIGCDARHRSAGFAEEAACVLAAAGFRVHLLPPRQPTPLLAFAVRHLAAAAGIMITASHNPPNDNGYKLYLGDGVQIIPPVDAEIEAAIGALGPLPEIPIAASSDPLIVRHADEVAQAYLDAILRATPSPRDQEGIRFIYTPLHGVAAELALKAFKAAGFPLPHMVAAQAAPDPDFPTVTFPNPEEPGALDLALAQARRIGADLVLASDPDGDRLAVAVPDTAMASGWRVLTGDQVGALLGAYLLEKIAQQELTEDQAETAAHTETEGRAETAAHAETGGQARITEHTQTERQAGPRDKTRTERRVAAQSGPELRQRLVATTVVSSTMLSKIAAAANARYAETLTGFKWIVRAADNAPGCRFVFGYEEALGYAVGQAVRDKDGISAALSVLSLLTTARASGQSLLDRWDSLERAHGVHLTAQLTLPTQFPGEVMTRLRANPPDSLAGHPIIRTTDLLGEHITSLPPADVLLFHLPAARVVVRPSGTEPKLKAYLEVVEPTAGRPLAASRAAAAARLEPLRTSVAALVADK